MTNEYAEDEGLKVDMAGFKRTWLHSAIGLAKHGVIGSRWAVKIPF